MNGAFHLTGRDQTDDRLFCDFVTTGSDDERAAARRHVSSELRPRHGCVFYCRPEDRRFNGDAGKPMPELGRAISADLVQIAAMAFIERSSVCHADFLHAGYLPSLACALAPGQLDGYSGPNRYLRPDMAQRAGRR